MTVEGSPKRVPGWPLRPVRTTTYGFPRYCLTILTSTAQPNICVCVAARYPVSLDVGTVVKVSTLTQETPEKVVVAVTLSAFFALLYVPVLMGSHLIRSKPSCRRL